MRAKESKRDATGFRQLPRMLFIVIIFQQNGLLSTVDNCNDPFESREGENGDMRVESPERFAGMKLNSLQFFGPCFAIE